MKPTIVSLLWAQSPVHARWRAPRRNELAAGNKQASVPVLLLLTALSALAFEASVVATLHRIELLVQGMRP